METLTKPSSAEKNGQEILNQTSKEYQGQADATEAKYMYREILFQVGKEGMNPEKMKNYIDGLPELFRTLPTSVLEPLSLIHI